MVEREASLVKPKHPQGRYCFMVPNPKKKGDYNEYPCLSHSQTNFDSKENGGKKKLFLQNQGECVHGA